ncbi:hypothetical protein [Leyella stercorea]|uniref:hypothetical protein n=1 Tax=Leyella stercorea TaxID=363265 RepID=UPI0026DC5D79|nr:hypothetical protein [Leyella stercorea]
MLYAIYFIYGLCVMFYFMMSWLFYRKDKKLLSRLVAVMMFVIGLQCLKDLFFIKPFTEIDELDWMVITAADMIVCRYTRSCSSSCAAQPRSTYALSSSTNYCSWNRSRSSP